MELLSALSKRRSNVDANATTWESSPAESSADAAALAGVLWNALPEQQWLKNLSLDEELEAPPVLEERGSWPTHSPAWSNEQEMKRFAALAKSLADMSQRLEKERSLMQADKDELARQESKIKTLEVEVLAERERQKQHDDLRKNYPQPAWLDNIEGTYNVGVVGNAGVGKSLLINKIRHLKPDDNDWAPVGVNETTLVPTPHCFPDAPQARLWDLPGGGTPKFPSDTYIQDMGLRYFDKVLIVSAGRFTSTEVELKKELDTYNVPYFMVRTKIDIDIWNNEKDNKRNPAHTLSEIREDLASRGISKPYLVSCRDETLHDFPMLLKDAFDGVRRSLDSNAAPFVPGTKWDDAWTLTTSYSEVISGLQGRWSGPDRAAVLVQGHKAHISHPIQGCAEIELEERPDGKVWWMSRWWVDSESIVKSRQSQELRWCPVALTFKPMVWFRLAPE